MEEEADDDDDDDDERDSRLPPFAEKKKNADDDDQSYLENIKIEDDGEEKIRELGSQKNYATRQLRL